MMKDIEDLKRDLSECQICAERFANTKTRHRPRPLVWFQPNTRILLASQAPGARAHAAGEPFRDRSGDRLRDWLGVGADTFYEKKNFAIVPMGFCFPGYNASGSDLPPPKVCAATWRSEILTHLTSVRLTLLIGGYAQKWHLGTQASDGVTTTVSRWKSLPPGYFALPHPSWRNTAWLKKNSWFEEDVLPKLKSAVKDALA